MNEFKPQQNNHRLGLVTSSHAKPQNSFFQSCDAAAAASLAEQTQYFSQDTSWPLPVIPAAPNFKQFWAKVWNIWKPNWARLRNNCTELSNIEEHRASNFIAFEHALANLRKFELPRPFFINILSKFEHDKWMTFRHYMGVEQKVHERLSFA